MKKLIILVIVFVVLSTITACSEKTPDNSNNKTTKINGFNYYPADDSTVRMFGRTYVSGNSLMFNWSMSGFEISFTGTRIDAKIFATQIHDEQRMPRIRIIIDEQDETAQTKDILIKSSDEFITLAQNLPNTRHTIKALRLTEAKYSQTGLIELRIPENESLEKPPETPERKIEFIGDSLTCGADLDVSPTAEYSYYLAREENPTKSYAGVTARILNAEPIFISASGWGINKKNESIPSIYEKTDQFNNPDVNWDFANNQMDAVVINLGTNDSENTNITTDYTAFLKTIRSKYPNAPIFVCYGMMGDILWDNMLLAVKNVDNVYTLRFALTKTFYFQHPSEQDHKESGELLANKIKEVTKWS